MLKKITATGIMTVAAAGAMMASSPAFADSTGTATTTQNGLVNVRDLGITAVVPVTALNNLGVGVLGSGAGGNTTPNE